MSCAYVVAPPLHALTYEGRTRGVQKVLQVDMLDWETFQNLYTNKTHKRVRA